MGKPSIAAGSGPFHFGQAVTASEVVASYTGKGNPDGGFWAKLEGFATDETQSPDGVFHAEPGDLVYAAYLDIDPPAIQTGTAFGPTPMWTGGPVHCRLILLAMDNGAFGRELASDEFEVGA